LGAQKAPKIVNNMALAPTCGGMLLATDDVMLPWSWEAFVRAYEPTLRAHARRWLKDENDVDDLTQETLFQAFKSLAGLRRTENPTGWLIRVQMNKLIDLHRRNQRALRLHELLATDTSSPENEPSTEDGLESNTLAYLAEHAEGLPGELGAIVRAGGTTNWNTKAMAQALRRTDQSIRRGKQKLKTYVLESNGWGEWMRTWRAYDGIDPAGRELIAIKQELDVPANEVLHSWFSRSQKLISSFEAGMDLIDIDQFRAHGGDPRHFRLVNQSLANEASGTAIFTGLLLAGNAQGEYPKHLLQGMTFTLEHHLDIAWDAIRDIAVKFPASTEYCMTHLIRIGKKTRELGRRIRKTAKGSPHQQEIDSRLSAHESYLDRKWAEVAALVPNPTIVNAVERSR
jgi:RNA polymerase sigma factor (sigma-70 family)